MLRKWVLIGMTLLVALSGVLVACAGGKESFAGKYVNEQVTSQYIVLREDGTYSMSDEAAKRWSFADPGKRGKGEYHLEGSELTVYETVGEQYPLFHAQIEPGRIIMPGGIVWVEEDKLNKEETPTPTIAPVPAPPTPNAPTPSESRPTSSPTTTPSVTPSPELLTLSPYEAAAKLTDKSLTDLQRKLLWDSYQGKEVHWIGQVYNVEAATDHIVVSVRYQSFYRKLGDLSSILNTYNVHLILPKDEAEAAASLRTGDLISYSGILSRRVDELYGGSFFEVRSNAPIESVVEVQWEVNIGRILMGALGLPPSLALEGQTIYISYLQEYDINAYDARDGSFLWGKNVTTNREWGSVTLPEEPSATVNYQLGQLRIGEVMGGTNYLLSYQGNAELPAWSWVFHNDIQGIAGSDNRIYVLTLVGEWARWEAVVTTYKIISG